MSGSLAAIWTIPFVVAIVLFAWIFVVLRADTHPGWKQKNNPPKYEVTGGSFDAVDGGRQVMPRYGGRPIPTQADRERAGHFGYVPPQGSAHDEDYAPEDVPAAATSAEAKVADRAAVTAALYCAVKSHKGAVMADLASQPPAPEAVDDPLPEAMSLAQGAADAGLGLKLLGGLAVRVIVPGLPPRLRAGQDIDFACLSRGRRDVVAYLERSGCQPDKRFNNLNGDRQMYFNAPSGRPIDVMVDRLTMCHTLDFRPAFGALPLTLSAMDILLSKLQIVELNEKDARDILQLLAGTPVTDGPASPDGPVLDASRFTGLVAADWGWWRTTTGNLEKLPELAAAKPELVPDGAPHDPLAQAAHLLDQARSVPKGMKWKLRANVGDRVRWYELPEEVGH